MKGLYFRISNALKIGWWAFKNPQTIQSSNMKMLSDVLYLILEVAKHSRPLMTKIAYIHPDTKQQCDIVAIWAGAGLGADPYKRIEELQKEIRLLKVQALQNINNG